jgi:hypothetical protein
MKIFEGSTAGANVNLTLRNDSTYDIKVTQIFCSLCDASELRKNINQEGTWLLSGDTISLAPADTVAMWNFLRLDNRKLQPLFSINRETYQIKNDSLRNRILAHLISSDLFTFDLFYETYDNGVVKTMVYEGRNRKFEITVSESGHIRSIKTMRGKRVKVLK